MILNKKQIRIILIILLVLLLIILAVWFLTQNKPEEKKPIITIEENIEPTIEEIEKSVPKIENKFIPQEQTIESKVISVSRNFSERFGSFSTDNKDENFDLLVNMVSNKMKQELENFIATNEKLNGEEYYGVSSKFLKADVNVLNSGNEATALVYLQQIENNNGVESVIDKKLNLELIKNGDNWIIDFAKWE